MTAKRILHLTLHRKWFDQIASGEKKHEYRDVKPYWEKRIINRTYDEIHFTNGYGKNRPFMRVKWQGYTVIGGNCIALSIGKILEIRNYTGAKNVQ